MIIEIAVIVPGDIVRHVVIETGNETTLFKHKRQLGQFFVNGFSPKSQGIFIHSTDHPQRRVLPAYSGYIQAKLRLPGEDDVYPAL